MGAALEAIDHIQRGRLLVQQAYMETGGPVGSPMGHWAGKGEGQKESKLKPSKSTHGFSPTRLHATETRRQGTSKAPKAVGYSNGRTLRAISDLPAKQQLWVIYVYNPAINAKLAAYNRLLPLLWREYSENYLGKARSTTQEAVRALLRIQLSQCSSYRDYLNWDADRPREVKAMDFNGGKSITKDLWRRKYEFHWRCIRQNLEELDKSAMVQISGAI